MFKGSYTAEYQIAFGACMTASALTEREGKAKAKAAIIQRTSSDLSLSPTRRRCLTATEIIYDSVLSNII